MSAVLQPGAAIDSRGLTAESSETKQPDLTDDDLDALENERQQQQVNDERE